MGQVLVCETCWEYQVGKFSSEGFEMEPYQSTLPEVVRQKLSTLCQAENLVENMYAGSGWGGEQRPRPVLGTIVSGSAVVANEYIRKHIQEQHRKIDGIEMEMAGVFRAVGLVDDSVIVVGAKAVVDFADDQKADDIHQIGARASARFLIEAVDVLLGH